MAKSAIEAIKKDKTTPVEDVFIDEDWKRMQDNKEVQIGFNT